MTKDVNDRRDRYVVTNPAGQSVFDITFPLGAPAAIQVFKDGVIVDAADYTVDLDVLTVTLDDDAAQGSIITLEGLRDIERTTNYPLRGDLRSQVLNGDMDALIEILQELRRDVDRTLILNKAESEGVSNVMPQLSQGRVLVWGTSSVENGPTTDNLLILEGISADISTVAGISANVTSVANNEANINAVAGISANVTTVAGISANVTTVANNEANINAVAADAVDIGVVATNIINVNAVATNIANVNTVAANDANITIVADDIADINTAASNMAAIIAAPSAALAAAASEELAEKWANEDEDVVVEGGQYSAFHWAAKAAAAASGSADNISYDPTASGLSATNVQDAIDELDTAIDDISIPAASTTVKGIVELATNAETITGTDVVRAVTPAGLQAKIDDPSVQKGLANAWVNFDGTGTVAIRDSYNVSSITDLGTGQYKVNLLGGAVPNANYAVSGCVNVGDNTSTGSWWQFLTGKGSTGSANSTSGFDVNTVTFAGSLVDAKYVHVVVYSS